MELSKLNENCGQLNGIKSWGLANSLLSPLSLSLFLSELHSVNTLEETEHTEAAGKN